MIPDMFRFKIKLNLIHCHSNFPAVIAKIEGYSYSKENMIPLSSSLEYFETVTFVEVTFQAEFSRNFKSSYGYSPQ